MKHDPGKCGGDVDGRKLSEFEDPDVRCRSYYAWIKNWRLRRGRDTGEEIASVVRKMGTLMSSRYV